MDDPDFVTAGGSRASTDALLDEQSGCWRRGAPRPVEEFLSGRTWLDTDDALDLIYHEILLRNRGGESPECEEYARRFPQYADQLRAHFEVHRAVFATPVPPSVTSARAFPTSGTAHEFPAVDGYEILAELGRGGSGVVYRARHTSLGRTAALKVLRAGPATSSREAARLRGEALALAKIGHQNIVQIYEFGETGGRPYLALEFAPGGTLQDQLRGARRPAAAAAALMETLARAVHAAHRVGVIHRDLKPGNVLFAEDGVPKVADFGLAKRLNADDAQTRTGDILGTPCYMAPEQVHGSDVGPAADVYALGAILYELTTGRPPFRSDSVWATLAQVIGREPVPPRQLEPETPRDLETICLKCLQKEPGQRYASAEALADDLARFLARRPITARPAPAWERAWKWVQRRPGAAGAAVAVAVLTVAAAVAHERDLRTRLDRAEHEAAAADVDRLLQGVRGKVNAGNWREANGQLHEQALARLTVARTAFPGSARLDELSAAAGLLQQQIDGRLTDAAQLLRYRALRHAVGFDATPFGGTSSTVRLQRTRERVAEALRLFDPGADRGVQEMAARVLTDAEKGEIGEGCCEMLLELADAEAAVPGADHGRVAGALDQAARLGGETPLIIARRAGRGVSAPAAPSPGFEWFLWGNDLCRAGRVAEARDAYQNALTARPGHFGARYALGVCYLKDRSGPGARKAHLLLAREHLTRCVQEHPEQAWPYLQRAMASDELGDSGAAESDYRAAELMLRSDPDSTTLYALYVNRGVGRISRRDPGAAIPDLTRAIELKPAELPAYFDLAKAYQDLKQPAKAREQLDRAAERTRPAALATVLRGRAKIHEEQGDWAAAINDLEEVVRREPGAAGDLRHVAQLLLKCDRADDALRTADAALAAAPDEPDAHRIRASVLRHLGRNAETVSALDRYVEGQRRAGRQVEPAVFRVRARAAAAAEDHAAAAEDYGRALDANDARHASADHAARGWCYVALGALPLAMRDFEQSVRLAPEESDGYGGRGYVLAKSGRTPEALRDAERALRLGADRPLTRYTAARIFALASTVGSEQLKLQHRTRAIELLREELEALPAAQRSDFWRSNVARDAALDAVRADERFRRLASECGTKAP